MKVDIFDVDKRYDVIYADPPWEYKQSGGGVKLRGMAKQHYSTMPTKEICSLPIRDICTDKAVCFLWATFPNLTEARERIIELLGDVSRIELFARHEVEGWDCWGNEV